MRKLSPIFLNKNICYLSFLIIFYLGGSSLQAMEIEQPETQPIKKQFSTHFVKGSSQECGHHNLDATEFADDLKYSFSNIPHHIRVYILSFLNAVDLTKVERISKTFQKAAADAGHDASLERGIKNNLDTSLELETFFLLEPERGFSDNNSSYGDAVKNWRISEFFSPNNRLISFALRSQLGGNSYSSSEAEILDELGSRLGKKNITKILSIESTRAGFLKSIDFANLSQKEQESVLFYLQGTEPHKLFLRNCHVLNESILSQNLHLSYLKKLDLSGCEGIGYRALMHIAQEATGVEHLNLSNIKGLKAIGDLGYFSNAPLVFNELRILKLNDCIALEKILICAPKLQSLNIANCSLLTDQMLDEVVAGSEFLQELTLDNCPLIVSKALREKFPNFPFSYWRYGYWHLTFNPKGDIDSWVKNYLELISLERALRINLRFSSCLRELDCKNSNLGDAGAKVLASRSFSSLRELNLSNNNIGDIGALTLVNGNLSALTYLNLSDNHIGSIGAKAIASGSFSSLRELNLNNNNIGDIGASALANGNLTTLEDLCLSGNGIGDEGFIAVANGNLVNLERLLIKYNNKMGVAGRNALIKMKVNKDVKNQELFIY